MEALESVMKSEHLMVKQAIEAFQAGEIDGAALKQASAPVGIYRQRNELFMVRVRLTGGQLGVAQLEFLADLIEQDKVGYGLITTRQDIQLHDVRPELIYDIIRTCTENGLAFRGGGGNTFRNVMASCDSGLSDDSVFDVLPYARQMSDFLLAYDHAFRLPRKFKVSFSCSESDNALAKMQDLGFVARRRDGQRGFEVYGGGGMGRVSAPALKLLDFMPAEDVLKCALAVVNLFYDHGDRENRSRARLRFVAARLGEDGFRQLFKGYFGKAEAPKLSRPQRSATGPDAVAALKIFDGVEPMDGAYEKWVEEAVVPTRFGADVVSLRLYVPEGHLSPGLMRAVVRLARTCGCEILRTTRTKDLWLPMVHRTALPVVYNFLKANQDAGDLTAVKIAGQIQSCVGATVCAIGILDAAGMALAIGTQLDALLDQYPGEKAHLIAELTQAIRVSGCPNTCCAHAVASLGLQGMRRKVEGVSEDVYKVFAGGEITPEGVRMGESTETLMVRAADLPAFMGNLVEDYIRKRRENREDSFHAYVKNELAG